MNKFTFKSKYGDYPNCKFVVSRYADNMNLSVRIISEEEGPIASVTTNTCEELPYDRLAIKDYSENEGMLDWLIENDIVEEEPCDSIESGFVVVPVHKLTENGKKILGF